MNVWMKKMEIQTIEKYLNKRVVVKLLNRFNYTFDFKPENIQGNTISIKDKFGELVDFDISQIIFIKEAKHGN